MIVFIPIIALLVGAAIALLCHFPPFRGVGGQYLALACLAGLDTVCGAIRSGMEGKFRNDIFITGFFSNVLIAFFLAWLGDQIYIDVFLAVALVMVGRVFTNLSMIRRFLITKWQDNNERKRLQKLQQAAPAPVEPNA